MTRTPSPSRSTPTYDHRALSPLIPLPIATRPLATTPKPLAIALAIALAIIASTPERANGQESAQANGQGPSDTTTPAAGAATAPPTRPAPDAKATRPAPDAKATRPAPDAKATRPALGAKAARDAALKGRKPLPEKTPEEKKADEAARASARARGEITFDDLKFDIEPDAPYAASMLTDSIRALDGKTIKLRGYILPSTLFRETDIEEFVLVRDNQECCFGPGAALYDCVVVNMTGGAKTDFTTRPVTVTGKFVLKEYKYPDDSGHFAIFNLQATAVK